MLGIGGRKARLLISETMKIGWTILPNTNQKLTFAVNGVNFFAAVFIAMALLFFTAGVVTGYEIWAPHGSGTGPGGGPTPTPTGTTPPPTTTPPTTTPPTTPPPTTVPPVNGMDATGNFVSCPNPTTASSPANNTFSGKTYDGAHATLGADVLYTVGSNTCIENFNFTRGELAIQGGATNVLILNNKFSGWPWSGTGQGRAIDGLLSGGSNIVVNYNLFTNPTGNNIWTGIYGRGGVTGLTVTHNHWTGMNVDDMQINCTATCRNVSVMYNKMDNAGRFIVEDQQIVHNEHWAYNYATVTYANKGGQVSLAHSNDQEGGGYFSDISSGIEADHNIVIDPGKQADFGDCFESRGPGNNFHDNYCWGYSAVDDYAFTSPQGNSAPNVWHVDNNTVVGPGSGKMSIWEGFERAGFTQVPATESGNVRLSYAQQPTPQPPAWNYANGPIW
jgi:hypothetical protein